MGRHPAPEPLSRGWPRPTPDPPRVRPAARCRTVESRCRAGSLDVSCLIAFKEECRQSLFSRVLSPAHGTRFAVATFNAPFAFGTAQRGMFQVVLCLRIAHRFTSGSMRAVAPLSTQGPSSCGSSPIRVSVTSITAASVLWARKQVSCYHKGDRLCPKFFRSPKHNDGHHGCVEQGCENTDESRSTPTQDLVRALGVEESHLSAVAKRSITVHLCNTQTILDTLRIKTRRIRRVERYRGPRATIALRTGGGPTGRLCSVSWRCQTTHRRRRAHTWTVLGICARRGQNSLQTTSGPEAGKTRWIGFSSGLRSETFWAMSPGGRCSMSVAATEASSLSWLEAARLPPSVSMSVATSSVRRRLAWSSSEAISMSWIRCQGLPVARLTASCSCSLSATRRIQFAPCRQRA